MTPYEAETLAQRIVQTWPRIGGAVDIWVEDIIDLDAGAANTAYVRLRREADRAPSIADFRRAVLALSMTDGSNSEPCVYCRDSGWVSAGFYEHKGAPYTAAEPCSCSTGERAAASNTWRNAPQRRFITRERAEEFKPRRESKPDVSFGRSAP